MSEFKKKKKSIGGTVTIGMGNPALDIKQFNKDAFPSLDDEINNENTVENSSVGQEAGTMAADATTTGNAGALGADAGAGDGGLSESKELQEKRETKRYYIRPQDIFCANKADVLKALIEVSEAGENCSVYTLKNLDDHDDVHELTNNDIIYYYDDDVLYDKNHVMVMDYDLFIKHEEERKNLGKSPETITKSELDQEYGDRMTKNTFVENLNGKINYEALKLALDRGEDVDLGSGFDSNVGYDNFSDGGIYANTTYVAGVDRDKYILYKTNWSDDGGEGSTDEVEFNDFDELYQALYDIEFDQCNIELDAEHSPDMTIETSDDPFDQTFESYDIYGNRLTEAKDEEPKVCCICGEEYEGYGNNAEPYKKGYCCDACNLKFVIPARTAQLRKDESLKENLEGNTQKVNFETDKYNVSLELFSADDELDIWTEDIHILNEAKGKGTIGYFADININVRPKNGGEFDEISMVVPFKITKWPFTFKSYDEGEEFNYANVVDWNPEAITDDNISFDWNQLRVASVGGGKSYDDYSEVELTEVIKQNEAKLRELIIINQYVISDEINERLLDQVIEDVGYAYEDQYE